MSDQSVPDLSFQSSFIDSRPEKPSAASTLYLRRFSTKTTGGADNHTVIGVHVVLAKENSNGLWKALHVDRATQRLDSSNPRVATRSLVICCDTLEVWGEFSLPEANVDVFARRLVWADEAASINTAPLAWTTEKARNASGSSPGQNGAEGRTAGSLRIFVREVSSVGSVQARLIASGGPGQAPGAGRDGTDGDSMTTYSRYLFSAKDEVGTVSSKSLSFDPPAVYIDYEWFFTVLKVGGTSLGENRWPKDGTNALAPGVPGSGGHGGSLTTNFSELARSLRNEGGEAGSQERNYRGGNEGNPSTCARYKVKLWANVFGTNDAGYECTMYDKHSVKGGASAKSQPAARSRGNKGVSEVLNAPNAWLHPLGLQAALEYGRDLFLAGGREELHAMLSAYHKDLCQGVPNTGVWAEVPASEWTAAQTEVATMMQRLAAHLDYFGHPAGYTPLLSLPGSIKLYENETKRALRMMLIANWVSEAAREAGEAAGLLTEALDAANKDSEEAAKQVAENEEKIKQIQRLIDTLNHDLKGLSDRLVALRTTLLAKATNDVAKHAPIKAAIKMAGALCQVIPVAQPALGTIGSLVGATSDFVGGDPDAAPDTLSKISQVLSNANDTASIMATVAPAAADEQGGPDRLNKIAVGLSAAVGLVSEGLQALQVPKSEVEAALARLEANDPAWKELTDKIRDVNEKKAALFSDLAESIRSVGEGFSRLAANAGAVVRFQQQRNKAVGKVDPEAVYAVQQLGQRSRVTLQKYLYLLVKSYESTLLKMPDVDWKLTAVTKKISELVKQTEGIKAGQLDGLSKILDDLFQQNLSALRKQLLDQFHFGEETTTLKLGLTAKQTPDVIAALNETGRADINPQVLGLLLPNQQLARLSKVTLTKVAFEPNGPSLPDSTNAVLSLVPAKTGILRREEGLYALASDSPVSWKWTYMSANDIRPATPSAAAQDILDFILGKSAIRGKVSLPPVWSELVISVLFSPPLAHELRPRFAELSFEVQIDSSPAPVLQKVLSIRATGSRPGAFVKCTPDLAGRGDGPDAMLRIYNRGATVQLSVPPLVGDAVFKGWEVAGVPVDRSALTSTALKLTLTDHIVALSQWARTDKASAPRAAALSAARPIRVEPQPAATIIAVIPPDGNPDVLESGTGTWQLVNYSGVVGWTEVEASSMEVMKGTAGR